VQATCGVSMQYRGPGWGNWEVALSLPYLIAKVARIPIPLKNGLCSPMIPVTYKEQMFWLLLVYWEVLTGTVGGLMDHKPTVQPIGALYTGMGMIPVHVLVAGCSVFWGSHGQPREGEKLHARMCRIGRRRCETDMCNSRMGQLHTDSRRRPRPSRLPLLARTLPSQLCWESWSPQGQHIWVCTCLPFIDNPCQWMEMPPSSATEL
jgi:hypothetical protein